MYARRDLPCAIIDRFFLQKVTKVNETVSRNCNHTSTPESSASSVCTSDPTALHPENELLRLLRRNKLNHILESDHPDRIPHIVITPPDSPYDGYWGFRFNGVEIQWDAYLTVPPRVEGNGNIITYDPSFRHTAWAYANIDQNAKAHCPWGHWGEYPRLATLQEPNPCPVGDESLSVHDGPHVFSPSEFNSEVESASQERLVMYHVIPAIHRIQYKVAVFQASLEAPSFRSRWDVSEFAESHDRPFEWVDEAEPLLAMFYQNPRAIIIDSTQPCTIPHIVIEEAEPQDPWEAYANAMINPQDARFLVIPHPCLTVINCEDTVESYLPIATYEDCFEEAEEVEIGNISELSSCASSDLSSDDESDPPVTPIDVPWTNDSQCLITKQGLSFDDEYHIDEDDDELPSLDDW
ncbi:hypothetical protein K474DRAFT_1702906 [Panus rudis PR-1116 ss-1]|nr:hypothetical protein K474DRAFT_1702906 [Panus rudis PR-1116 ss-1]